MDVLVAHPDLCWQCGLWRAENWVFSGDLIFGWKIPSLDGSPPITGLCMRTETQPMASAGSNLKGPLQPLGTCITVSSPSAQFCCPDLCVSSFWGHNPTLVSKGYHDKVPYMGWLTATVTWSLSVLDLEGPCSFWRLQGRLSPGAFLLGSGVAIDLWHSGLQMCHLGLCVDYQVASHNLPTVCACLCVSFPFFWIRTHPNDLILMWLYL